MKSAMTVVLIFLITTTLTGQAQQAGGPATRDPRDAGGGQCAENALNCMDAVRPVAALDSVWIEELTWMEVRDALRAGKTTAIIATGGVEPNGPYLATGKHNYVLRANCEAIARTLGNALVAPVIAYVPEGDIEPQTGHMRSPGTISLRQETYRALLTDVAHSLKMHGFKNIIMIGDSGGNQAGMRAVAETLNAKWPDVLVAHIPEYYDYKSVAQFLGTLGVRSTADDRLHDDPGITMNMMVADPTSVRWEQRVKANRATINGVSIADKAKAVETGRKIVEMRANNTVAAIRKAINGKVRSK
jgi:creatinine amidohydrolase/Fe(II)-dependent formamide hydrolase-like protein